MIKTKFFFTFTFLLLVTFINCNRKNPLPKNSEYKMATRYYAGNSEELQSLDIYYSENTSELKPIVIWVHGGGWCIGDKTNKLENKISLFESLGSIFVSANYRLSPFPYETDNNSRIKFPTHSQDVAKAIAYIHQHGNEFGGDISKIALIGHSAGAHLVALTGTNEAFLENEGLSLSDIKGLAVIDTEGFDIHARTSDALLGNLYINAFGTDSLDHAEASPILHIRENKKHPDFFIGKRGNNSREAIADEFIEALEEEKVNVTSIYTDQYSHEGINDAIGNDNIITPALVNFFTEIFED